MAAPLRRGLEGTSTGGTSTVTRRDTRPRPVSSSPGRRVRRWARWGGGREVGDSLREGYELGVFQVAQQRHGEAAFGQEIEQRGDALLAADVTRVVAARIAAEVPAEAVPERLTVAGSLGCPHQAPRLRPDQCPRLEGDRESGEVLRGRTKPRGGRLVTQVHRPRVPQRAVGAFEITLGTPGDERIDIGGARPFHPRRLEDVLADIGLVRLPRGPLDGRPEQV